MTTPGHNSSVGDRLLSHIQAIEALLEQKKEIADEISARKAQAKGEGFDVKIINQLIKERAMSAAERAEWQALLDIYRAALGMLDGTPLGDFAKKRMMGEDEEPATKADADGEPVATDDPIADPETGEVDEPASTVEDARAQGREAARSGVSIVKNPWPYGDPRRAAWDEGYCAESGTDGMELPPAWRRKKDSKKGGGAE